MIPELVGRLPVISSLAPLNHEGLVRVLTEPKNALLRQYKTLFEMEDCHLEFSEGALQAIARKALQKKTGARGLRSIVEEAMVDIMFELPDQPKGSTYVIDEDVVEGRRHLFPLSEPISKSA
jgi:ATP-dependent Clp protease ATP-binding subunit ClpX